MPYNITNVTNIESVFQLANFANGATNGLFWGLVVIAMFFIITITLLRYGAIQASISAGFICLLISIVMMNLGFVSLIYPIIFGLLIGGGAIYMLMNRGY